MTDQILSKRLVLRPFRAEDSDRVIDLLGNFQVSQWLGRVPYPLTREGLKIVGPNGESRWPNLVAITLDDAVIGGTGISDHLGYWIGQPYWGHGYATEAARVLRDQHFKTTQNDVLCSGYFEGNTGSARVLEKLGFEETGRRLNYSVSNDRDMPHVDLRLTRADWEATQ